MLSRACDYIQIIISHILDDKTNNQSALIDFHNHLSVIPNDGLGELSSLCALEIKTRLKVCSVRVAQVLANDDYLKICLDREYNLLSKRDAEKATPGSIDFPSEELNATWDVFLPSEDLSKMRDDYNLMILPVQKPPAAEPSAVRMSPDSNATVEAGGSTKNLETMRAQISTKLQHVYLSRAELNRYRASKNEIRGRYYTVLSMGMFACAILLILLLAYDHWAGIIKFDENQWKIDQQLNAARILILVLGAGALGSVLALMPKFRGMSRITDYRQAFVMLVAQIFTGATFALLFFLYSARRLDQDTSSRSIMVSGVTAAYGRS